MELWERGGGVEVVESMELSDDNDDEQDRIGV